MIATEAPLNQREAILDQALSLMSAHGAAGTSMRQLAAACGLHVAAIYHYFESKDALLAAVVAERRYGARLLEHLPIDPAATAPERLSALYRHIWRGALAEESIWRLLLGEGLHGSAAALAAGRELLALVEAAAAAWIEELIPEIEAPALIGRLLVTRLLSDFVREVFADHAATDAEPEASHAERAAADLIAVVFGRAEP